MTTIDDEALDAIEARANAATEGPWYFTEGGQCCHGVCADPEALGIHDTSIPYSDAAFIAAARTDVPALTAEVRRLRAENERLSGDLRATRVALTVACDEADSEAATLRSENDELHRTLLDETYRPEGGEIVMRELREAQRERDEARAEVERLRNEIIGWDHGAAILRADLERARECVDQDVENLRGDLHHLVAPLIGWMRRAERDNDPKGLMDWIGHSIERLCLVLALLDQAAVGQGPIDPELRREHGLGLSDGYPSLRSSVSSPCVSEHVAAPVEQAGAEQ